MVVGLLADRGWYARKVMAGDRQKRRRFRGCGSPIGNDLETARNYAMVKPPSTTIVWPVT
jgi:hypothetical protein